MKYSSFENFETARIYIYIYLSVLLGRNFRHLYSPAGNLIVSRRGVCRSVSRSKGARDSPPGNAALFRSSSPIAAEVDFSGRALSLGPQDLRASVHVSGVANLRAEPGVV